MPQDRKIAEKKLREVIKQINTRAETKISYKAIYKKVNRILSMPENEREAAFTAAYIDLSKEISQNILPKAVLAQSNFILSDRYMNTPVEKFSITISSKEAKTLIEQMCELISPGYPATHPINENQLTAIRDYELSTHKSHTFYSDINGCMKQWDKACYDQDIATFDDFFAENYTYKANKNDSVDVAAAEYYYKLQLTRERFSRHGAIWRFFHPKKADMYRTYIQTMEQKLDQIGFKEEEHGETALNFLRENIIPPLSLDVEAIKKSYKELLRQYRVAHTKPLTIARDKLVAARLLDANPETSLDKKIEPFLKKYGLEKLNISNLMNELDKAAQIYDTTRFLDGYNDIVLDAFDKSISALFSQAVKNGGEINIRDIMHDARMISVTVAQHYTPLLEANEFSALEKPLYMIQLDAEKFSNRFGRIVKINHFEVAPDKLDIIKKDAMDVVREWKADPKKLLREDAEFSKSISGKDSVLCKGENIVVGGKLLTAEEKAFGDKLFEIGFRPTYENLNKEIEMFNVISRFIKGNPNLTNEAKRVYVANQNKIRQMKVAMKNPHGEKNFESEFQAAEDLLKAECADYKPMTMNELAQGMNGKERMSVNLDENLENKNLQDNVKVSEHPVPIVEVGKDKEKILPKSI